MKIKITADGKRIFNKNKAGLIRKIVQKISSHLPHTSRNCENEYSVGLEEVPLFECQNCGAPSHNCEDIKRVKQLFPTVLPRGFIWVCGKCDKAKVLSQASILQESDDVALQDQTENSIDKGGMTTKETEKVPTKHESGKKLCKHYVQKKCRHGAKGVGCSFSHPQKCFKFMRNGSYARGGCTKGKNCQYYHPPLCRGAVRTGICSAVDCNYHHIKGTKFSEEFSSVPANAKPSQNSRNPVSEEPNQAHFEPRTKIKVLQRPSFANVAATRASRPEEAAELQGNSSPNFLEVKHQIQQMQIQIDRILKMNLNQTTETKICRCQAIYH